MAGVAIGGVGVAAAKGTKRTPRRDWFDRLMDDTDRAQRDETLRAAHSAAPDVAMAEEVMYHPFGPPCCLAALALPLAVMPVFGTAGGATGTLAAGSTRIVWQKMLWKRGHAVWGFLAGGLLGLGVSVLLWQYAVWLLTIWTVFVLPLVVAIVAAVYAWYGRRYLARVTIAASAPMPVPVPPAVDDDGPEWESEATDGSPDEPRVEWAPPEADSTPGDADGDDPDDER